MKMVKYLIENGAQINLKNYYIIDSAIINERISILKYLLEKKYYDINNKYELMQEYLSKEDLENVMNFYKYNCDLYNLIAISWKNYFIKIEKIKIKWIKY